MYCIYVSYLQYIYYANRFDAFMRRTVGGLVWLCCGLCRTGVWSENPHLRECAFAGYLFSSSWHRANIIVSSSLVIFKPLAAQVVLKRKWVSSGRSTLRRFVFTGSRTPTFAGLRFCGFLSCPAPPLSNASISTCDSWLFTGFGAV